MNLNDMTFGCEIECFIPAAAMDTAGISVGGYHYGRQIPNFPAGWNAQSDGSLSTDVSGMRAVEVVSGILKGTAGLLEVVEVVAKLNEMGAIVNRTCGFHVHVGFPAAALNKVEAVAYLTANLEKALYAASGTKARERGNYCRPIKENYRTCNFKAATPRQWGGAAGNRFHTLNVSNLIGGNKPTIEFRVFSGTLNATKMVAYIRMALAIVHRATNSKKRVEWDARSQGMASGAVTGKDEMERFFYRMGWNRGCTPLTFGALGVEDSRIPGLDACKAELYRLAEKYDAMA